MTMTRVQEIDLIAKSLAPTLMQGQVTAERIHEVVFSPIVDGLASINNIAPMTEAEKTSLQNDFAYRFLHIRDLNEAIFAEPFERWLEAAKPHIDFRFWNDYRSYLLGAKKFDKDTVDSIDHVTDNVIDLGGDPAKNGLGLRKGLVVGNVQSGKTADYIGVITKAADCGYRVVVVLAGILDNLRSQTQERIDEGFIGVSKIEVDEDGQHAIRDRVVGVGANGLVRPHAVLSLTTLQSDFNSKTAQSITTTFGAKDGTIYVAVIKKNSATLKSLIKWLSPSMCTAPMLLIDDEADNASINYKDYDNPTTINKLVRDLISKFPRATYVGYTATPFANIFIDPDVVTADHGEDLFPRDFIVALEASDRYMGPSRIFGENVKPEDDIVREIKDNESVLPVKHVRTHLVDCLPPSMLKALDCYVLATAIRICRGDATCHSSALINVSRFIDVHQQIAQIVRAEVASIKDAIRVCGRLHYEQNSVLTRLHDVYVAEYGNCGTSWDDVQLALDKAALSIEVLEIHMKGDVKYLDYSRERYPNGRRVIAVGGFSLSRGLTLEGLCSSYILRNSKMYDTLMQMGRWFGYRNGYGDLCRIFMTPEARGWYKHITLALAELWDQFRTMAQENLTPSQFGLRVRAHPLSLIVTAKNKMKAAVEMTVQVDLAGQKVETSHVLAKDLEFNRGLLDAFVKDLGKPNASPDPSNGFYWKRIPNRKIAKFITEFRRADVNMDTASGPLCDYLKKLGDTGMDVSDVFLTSGKMTGSAAANVADLPVIREAFAIEVSSKGMVVLGGGRQHITGADQERAGMADVLSTAAFETAKTEYLADHKSIPGHFYRRFRSRPVLILHVIDGKLSEGAPKLAYDCSEIVAWRLVFPGAKHANRANRLVSYVLNPIAARAMTFDDDDNLEEE